MVSEQKLVTDEKMVRNCRNLILNKQLCLNKRTIIDVSSYSGSFKLDDIFLCVTDFKVLGPEGCHGM